MGLNTFPPSRQTSASLFSIFLCYLLAYAWAQAPPQPEDIDIRGTSFLDHNAPIATFTGKTLLRQNIPYIDIPDKNIQDTYYYRFSTIARHLRHSLAGAGYVLTEFMQPVFYSKTFSTINAAAGHHIDEARWLRSNFYTNDYSRFWTCGPGDDISYTQWNIDTIYRKSRTLDGNTAFLTSQLQGLVRMWREWDFTFDSAVGLYYYTPLFDAQEFSLPCWVASNSGQNNLTLLLIGPDTYRPSHNTYMVANARAIALTAQLASETTLAREYTSTADHIEAAMYEHLWDSDLQFFIDVIKANNHSQGHQGPVQGRQLVGLFPFRFGIGLTAKYANLSIQELFDPEGFQAPFGPTTLERRNEYYGATKPTTYCCY